LSPTLGYVNAVDFDAGNQLKIKEKKVCQQCQLLLCALTIEHAKEKPGL
jgi:hypothetical protein